jgi:hypothetical protein
MTAKQSRARLAKLEQTVRTQPCPQCGHTPNTDTANVGTTREPDPDFSRLTEDERRELAELLHAYQNPPCATCGHAGIDIEKITDAQKERALELLRKCSDR